MAKAKKIGKKPKNKKNIKKRFKTLQMNEKLIKLFVNNFKDNK
jgi:hypothetical protein